MNNNRYFPSEIVKKYYIPANITMPQSNFGIGLGLAEGIVDRILRCPEDTSTCLYGDFDPSSIDFIFSKMNDQHQRVHGMSISPSKDRIHGLIEGMRTIALQLPPAIASRVFGAFEMQKGEYSWFPLLQSRDAMKLVSHYLKAANVRRHVQKATLAAYKQALLRGGSKKSKAEAQQIFLEVEAGVAKKLGLSDGSREASRRILHALNEGIKV